VRIFKVKAFARWARKEGIKNDVLLKAVREIQSGLIDAQLGAAVVKKRIPASSRGKRGGARTIVAFHSDKHIFFMYGYLKNDTADIDHSELKAIRQYAQNLLDLTEDQIRHLVSDEALVEVI